MSGETDHPKGLPETAPIPEGEVLYLGDGKTVDLTPLDDESRQSIIDFATRSDEQLAIRGLAITTLEQRVAALEAAVEEARAESAQRESSFLAKFGFAVGFLVRVIRAEMRRVSPIDELTGLKSRHSLLVDLRKEIKGAQVVASRGDQRREAEPETRVLFMQDLDGFKLVNDKLGHPFGDFYLITFARQLDMRKGDEKYRLGGDEFAVLARNGVKTRDDQLALALRIQGQVLATTQKIVKMSNSPEGLVELRKKYCRPSWRALSDSEVRFLIADAISEVNISIGIAEITGSFFAQDVILKADQALYEAKRFVGTSENIKFYKPSS